MTREKTRRREKACDDAGKRDDAIKHDDARERDTHARKRDYATRESVTRARERGLFVNLRRPSAVDATPCLWTSARPQIKRVEHTHTRAHLEHERDARLAERHGRVDRVDRERAHVARRAAHAQRRALLEAHDVRDVVRHRDDVVDEPEALA